MFDGPNMLYRPLHYNSGFVFIRNSLFVRQIWQFVFANFAYAFDYGGEQRLINVVMSGLRESGLRTARLPEDIFVNGHVIARALRENVPLPGMSAVVHASWTRNIDRKIEHLKTYGLWYVQSADDASEHGVDAEGPCAPDAREPLDPNWDETLAKNDMLVRSDGVKLHRHQKTLYLSVGTGALALQINEIGHKVWSLCDGNRSIEGIITLLGWLYDDRNVRLHTDVIETLQAFLAAGVVKRVVAEAATPAI
jgi:hypothetical protein